MPYTTKSPNLPSNVKKLGSNAKKRWVSTFNSTLAQCKRDGGGDCEAKAFRVANGNLKKSESSAPPEEKVTDVKIVESKFSEADPVEILEVTEGDGDDGEKILKVNFMREGPGNKAQNNYYTKAAVESVKKFLDTSRKKMYLNHTQSFGFERDIRDWASSVVETWIEKKNGRNYLNGKVKVLDQWLWDRAQAAPKELSLSIEGRGKAEPGKIDGKEYNVVSEINWLNCVSWVDYPGNAKMGVKVGEGEQEKGDSIEKKDKEESTMLDFTKMTEADEKRLKDERPDLFEDNTKTVESMNGEVKKLQESMKQFKDAFEQEKKAMAEKVSALESEKAKLANLVEAHEIRAKGQEKKALVEGLLASSKLPENAKTPTFRESLLALKDKKIGDTVTTVEQQAKELIEDREKVCVADLAEANAQGDKKDSGLTEKEQQDRFNKSFFGVEPEAKK